MIFFDVIAIILVVLTHIISYGSWSTQSEKYPQIESKLNSIGLITMIISLIIIIWVILK